jgi:hypothetical protein
MSDRRPSDRNICHPEETFVILIETFVILSEIFVILSEIFVILSEAKDLYNKMNY